jgi:hypothetical protein
MEDNLLNSLFSSKPLVINEKEKYKSSYEASIALENYSKLIKV